MGWCDESDGTDIGLMEFHCQIPPGKMAGLQSSPVFRSTALRAEFQLGLTTFPAAARANTNSTGEDVVRLVGRFHALRQLQHPNLARYIDILVGRDHLFFLITEHSSRTLADVVEQSDGLGEAAALQTAAHVVAGLCHLNSRGLVHGHLELNHVLIAEDGFLKLSAHGLCHLTRHGRLTDFPLQSRGQYVAPELALDGRERSVASPCCKPDVWSLGVIVLEVLTGYWHAEPSEELEIEESVKLQTTCELKRFVAVATERQSELTVTTLLGDSTVVDSSLADGIVLPLPTHFAGLEPARDSAQRVKESYRRWLSGRSTNKGCQELCDFWKVCLTAHPSSRPTPHDLASHPALAEMKDVEPGVGGQKWSCFPGLRSERIAGKSVRTESSLQYLRNLSVEVEHVYHWWNLAGGDPFSTLAERQLLRPIPSILQVPLYVRDTENDCSARFLEACLVKESLPKTPEPQMELGLMRWSGQKAHETREDASVPLRGLWGPTNTTRPCCLGVDLKPLCAAVASAERLGVRNAKDIRPGSMYERTTHFTYQWLRVRQFQQLLLLIPKSRPEIFREAAEDLPPLLRPQLWAVILGTDCDSDSNCWAPFYERLCASPAVEERKIAVQTWMRHELLSNPEGRQRLERIVHAVLKANPSLQRVDGLGSVAAPLSIIYAHNETAAFLVLQRILHQFLWQFYAVESSAHRRQSTHLFSALLRFVDPELELHLQAIGMEPEIFSGSWFSTWFAQLLPLQQLLMLWDAILLRLPQFPLFVGVCLIHFFRQALLGTDDVSAASNTLGTVQLVDIAVLVQASVALFQAVPGSVTLPLYPRHSAGDAFIAGPGEGMVSMDPTWENLDTSEMDPARKQLVDRAMEQWEQSDWWRKRAATRVTTPIITVDDLLSFRSRCFVLDVRKQDEFAEGHFQASVHVRDPEDRDLANAVPPEILSMGATPRDDADPEAEQSSEHASPWLFGFDQRMGTSPELRVRLVVVIGNSVDCGADFAERLVCAGVRHVVCLLGGVGALKADAPSYLTKEH